MALYIKQQEKRTELQERLAAELQEKARAKAKEAELPDGVTDSHYIKNTKQTSSLGWVWILIGFIVVGLIIWLVIATAQ
jgi:hypothetical protein